MTVKRYVPVMLFDVKLPTLCNESIEVRDRHYADTVDFLQGRHPSAFPTGQCGVRHASGCAHFPNRSEPAPTQAERGAVVAGVWFTNRGCPPRQCHDLSPIPRWPIECKCFLYNDLRNVRHRVSAVAPNFPNSIIIKDL